MFPLSPNVMNMREISSIWLQLIRFPKRDNSTLISGIGNDSLGGALCTVSPEICEIVKSVQEQDTVTSTSYLTWVSVTTPYCAFPQSPTVIMNESPLPRLGTSVECMTMLVELIL